MDSRVKKFIEENINLIEAEAWKEFFRNLLSSMSTKIVPNFYYLVLFILKEANVNFSRFYEDIGLTEIDFHKALTIFSDLSLDFIPGRVVDTDSLYNNLEGYKIIKVALALDYEIYQYADDDQYIILKPNYTLEEYLKRLSSYQDVPPISEFIKIN